MAVFMILAMNQIFQVWVILSLNTVMMVPLKALTESPFLSTSLYVGGFFRPSRKDGKFYRPSRKDGKFWYTTYVEGLILQQTFFHGISEYPIVRYTVG